MDENKIVLCGANAYEKKYYFNEEQFKMIPESIKEELHIICVLFTEEVGGVFTIAFEEDGNVVMETNADDDDIYYDEVSSGLLIAEIRRSRQELFESLSLYYRVFIKKEDVSELLEKGGEATLFLNDEEKSAGCWWDLSEYPACEGTLSYEEVVSPGAG